MTKPSVGETGKIIGGVFLLLNGIGVAGSTACNPDEETSRLERSRSLGSADACKEQQKNDNRGEIHG